MVISTVLRTPVTSEHDFFIRKSIGWAVRAFLAQHADRLSGLTRREAGKHLG